MAGKKSTAVVGGGLVGTLQAIYMAKEGYEVHLYESRKDLRATGTCTYERSFAVTDSAVKSVLIFASTEYYTIVALFKLFILIHAYSW